MHYRRRICIYFLVWILKSFLVISDFNFQSNFTHHSEKSVTSLPKSFNVFFTRLYSSTSMVVGMGLKPYFWPPKKTKLGPKDMSLQFWISSRQIPVQVVLCQINIFCHQLNRNTTTDFVRFTYIPYFLK